ncbi:hypothetical protein HKT22_37345, partial [Pseudomonas aeruginosa]|nr:hypothetical protein [Pseudomonas aeruginosa]
MIAVPCTLFSLAMTDLIPAIDLSTLPKREFLEAVAQENAFRIAQDAPWITNVGEMA